MAALELLKKDEHVDPSRIGAIGYCFGGGVVLNMAREGADLKAVVSFHGSLATQHRAQKGTVKARVLVCNGADDLEKAQLPHGNSSLSVQRTLARAYPVTLSEFFITNCRLADNEADVRAARICNALFGDDFVFRATYERFENWKGCSAIRKARDRHLEKSQGHRDPKTRGS